MDIALSLLVGILVISTIYAIALTMQYLKVTKKRRELIAALGGSGRAVPRFKHALMTTYIVSVLVWTLGFLYYFFHISS